MGIRNLWIGWAIILGGCASIETGPVKNGIAAVTGEWIYSHVGKPTVWEDDIPDPSTFIDNNMEGCRISIAEDGQTSLLAPSGDGGNFKLLAAEESPLHIKLQAEDAPEKNWTYDKKSRLIIMPMELELRNSSGSIPAYFKRE